MSRSPKPDDNSYLYDDLYDHSHLSTICFDSQAGGIPNMYGNPAQGRNTSNPRAYTTPDIAGVQGEQRREDGQQQVYQDNGYAYQQGGSYPGMANVNYQYGSQGVG